MELPIRPSVCDDPCAAIGPDALPEAQAVKALGALAQNLRLRAFRALIVAGPDGLTPGALAALLGVAPSTLSFHLKELVHAGLAQVEPSGRHLIYRARFDRMRALLAYLTRQCCDGAPCELSRPESEPERS